MWPTKISFLASHMLLRAPPGVKFLAQSQKEALNIEYERPQKEQKNVSYLSVSSMSTNMCNNYTLLLIYRLIYVYYNIQ